MGRLGIESQKAVPCLTCLYPLKSRNIRSAINKNTQSVHQNSSGGKNPLRENSGRQCSLVTRAKLLLRFMR